MNYREKNEGQLEFKRQSSYSIGQHGTLAGIDFTESTLDPPRVQTGRFERLDGTCEASVTMTVIKYFTTVNAVLGAASLKIPTSEIPAVIKQLKRYHERHKVQKPIRKVSRKK